MQNKHVIHLPSLPLSCLMLSCRILPLWVHCLQHCWFVPGCSNAPLSFLSAELLLFGSIRTSITRVKSKSFLLLLPRSWNSPPCTVSNFCPELMRFLTCLRIPRIKPLSLGRGRFRKIISNSLNHHGSRKRESSFYWVKRFTDWRQGQREKYSLPSLPPSVLQKKVLENKVGTESFSIVVGVSESHGTKGMRPGGSPREVNQCICAHMQDVAGDYSCTNLVPVIPISDVSSGVLENT